MYKPYPKLILIVFLSVAAGRSSAQKPTILSGSVYGLDRGSKVYLTQTAKAEILDSFPATKDSFYFRINIEQGDVYFFRYTANLKRFDWPVYLQKGSDVNVAITKNGEHITFSGSQLAEEQNDFIAGLYSFSDKEALVNAELQKEKDSFVINKLKLEKENINKKRSGYYETWVKSHTNSPFSIAVIYLFMQGTDDRILEGLYENLSVQAKENNLVVQSLPNYFANRKMDEHFKIGQQLKDFVLNDTSGGAHSFYSLKGTGYVLLDFWASWCGPCRKSSPEISRLSDMYKPNNFRVISISADTDAKKWKDAIVKDKMHWYHLSDLKGTGSGYIKDNNIFAFPTYILISPAGDIIAKPYNIARVTEKLAEIFPKL